MITRFSASVNEALARTTQTKAWVAAAIGRQGAPRCPIRLNRLSYELILRHEDLLRDLLVAYPDDLVTGQAYDWAIGWQRRDELGSGIDPVHVLTHEAQWIDEWGTVWRHVLGGVGPSPVGFPLEDWSRLDRYLHMDMPRADVPGRLDGVLPELDLHGTSKYFVGWAHLTLFERYHCLRGFERAFEDFYAYPGELASLLDALTDYYVGLVRRWAQLPGVDALFMTDDWGTQLGLMISPEMWRGFFAKRYRRIFDEAHRGGLDVWFHTDGDVFDIVGDLIDLGIDVLDPVQPEALDVEALVREYGGKIAFSGGLSVQRLAIMTAGEVQEEVLRMIDILGPFGNAYVISPTNSIMPETPPENLEALFQACHSL